MVFQQLLLCGCFFTALNGALIVMSNRSVSGSAAVAPSIKGFCAHLGLVDNSEHDRLNFLQKVYANMKTDHGRKSGMAALMHSRNWSDTSLGPVEQWPKTLYSYVDLLLQITVPAILSWGEQDILINNEACRQVFNLYPNFLEGNCCEDWPHSKVFRNYMHSARNEGNGATFSNVDMQILEQEDVIRHASFTISFSALHDEYGNAAGTLALFFDTTNQMLAENSLRDSEMQLEAIFSNAQVGLSLISLDGRFIRVNDAVCRLLGRSRDVLLQSTVADVTHPDDLNMSTTAVLRVIATGEPQSVDKVYLRPDGQPVPANSILSRLERSGDKSDCLILAVTIDLTKRKQALDALAGSEAKFRALSDASSALIWQLDAQGKAIYINPRHHQLLGVPCEQLLGNNWASIFHPDERSDMVHLLRDGIKRGTSVQRRVRVRYSDGEWHWTEVHAAPWFTASGDYAGHVGISLDIDDLVSAQQDLLVSNERLRLAIEGSGDGVWDWDLVHNRVDYSERAVELLHLRHSGPYDPIELLEQIVHPDDKQNLEAEIRACLTGARQSFQVEFRIHGGDDQFSWVLSRGTVVVHDPKSHIAQRMTGTFTDITAKRRAAETAWNLANFDALTGLPNRRLFRDRLDQVISKSQRSGIPLALLFIDLDNFKEANDMLGHSVGDLVLAEAGRRICSCVRRSDTVARLGGDEFTVILTEIDANLHVESVAQKINEVLSEPFSFENQVVHLSASVGVTIFPCDATAAEDLIRNADQAMYAVKSAGRNHFSYFTPSMQREANERLLLIRDLRGAIAARQLQVHYQPIIDLHSGRLVKAEALLRWQHPSLGMLEPKRFIRFAEETGMINEIGDWVFCQAAICSRSWGMRTGRPFPVSVNKSAVQFVPRINEVNWPAHLKQLGLTGESVAVEITESMLLEASSNVTVRLQQYHDAGIKVAIDDFGTGYSSIAYLKKFEVDFLKIDRSFVQDISASPSDLAIVRSIIAMAHELGLEVIAEGIETVEQREILADVQCDFGQGYFFSKPVPSGEFERMLAAW